MNKHLFQIILFITGLVLFFSNCKSLNRKELADYWTHHSTAIIEDFHLSDSILSIGNKVIELNESSEKDVLEHFGLPTWKTEHVRIPAFGSTYPKSSIRLEDKGPCIEYEFNYKNMDFSFFVDTYLDKIIGVKVKIKREYYYESSRIFFDSLILGVTSFKKIQEEFPQMYVSDLSALSFRCNVNDLSISMRFTINAIESLGLIKVKEDSFSPDEKIDISRYYQNSVVTGIYIFKGKGFLIDQI